MSLSSIYVQQVLSWLLRAYLFLLPWQTVWIIKEKFINGSKWEYGTLGFYGTEILLWTIVVLFAIWYWNKKKLANLNSGLQIIKPQSWFKDWEFFSCLLFLVYCLLSSLWAFDLVLALQSTRYVLQAMLLFFILRSGPLNISDSMRSLVVGSFIPSILGIVQFLTQTTFSSSLLGLSSHPAFLPGSSVIASAEIGRWLRAYGSFSHPNVFGGYLVLGLLCSLVLLYNNDSVLGSRRWRIFFLSNFFIQISALFFSFSRSAWLASALVLIAFFFLIKSKSSQWPQKKIWFLTSVIAFITLLSFVYNPLLKTRFNSSIQAEARSLEERLTGYNQAWELWRSRPWFGVGIGNYTLGLFDSKSSLPGWVYQPVHNVLSLLLVELGLTGSLLAFLLIISVVRKFKFTYCLLLIPLPLLLFDHYLISSFVGWQFLASWFFYSQSIHS